ncbi:MAG: hypothetical protein OHK0039_06630 [Bacteroidia bacterium]
MDIFTHTLSGLGVATVAAAFYRVRPAQQAGMVLLGGVGAIVPDIDAFSLWSGFDATLGAWLGQEGHALYYGTHWLSHRGFFHSLFASLLVSVSLALLSSLLYRVLRRAPSIGMALRYLFPYWLCFWLGYLIHLVGDLPTPGGPWGGIRLFFPSETYVGGWGWVWWWNNYDIFLLLLGVVLANVLLLVGCEHWSRRLRFLPILMLCYALGMCVYEMRQRHHDFNTGTFDHNEHHTLDLQRQVLGPGGCEFMQRIDEAVLPIYF